MCVALVVVVFVIVVVVAYIYISLFVAPKPQFSRTALGSEFQITDYTPHCKQLFGAPPDVARDMLYTTYTKLFTHYVCVRAFVACVCVRASF